MDMTLNEIKYLNSTFWDKKQQTFTIDMSRDKYIGRSRLRLNSLLIPDSSPS